MTGIAKKRKHKIWPHCKVQFLVVGSKGKVKAYACTWQDACRQASLEIDKRHAVRLEKI